MSAKPRHRKSSGFTLIEMLVVLAIIATLVAVVAPSVFRNVGDAKSTAAQTQVDGFVLALGSYRLDTDRYPSSEQGLAALRERPVTDAPLNWRGPYVSKVIGNDPWGRPWIFISPGKANPEAFDLYSLGRDGTAGGSGEDADVTSWGGAVAR